MGLIQSAKIQKKVLRLRFTVLTKFGNINLKGRVVKMQKLFNSKTLEHIQEWLQINYIHVYQGWPLIYKGGYDAVYGHSK